MVVFQSEESVFNFAVEYLKGISESLKMCEQMSAFGKPEGWINWLRIAFRQLSAKTTPIEDEEFNKEFREINVLINNPLTLKTQRTIIFYKLDMLETKLRKKLQAKGMLLPNKENSMFAVLKR